MLIVGSEPRKAWPKLVESKRVDAGIDLVDGALLVGELRIFHDGGDGAVLAAQDAPITGRIGDFSREDGGGGVALFVDARQRCQRLGADQRGVSRQHDHVFRAFRKSAPRDEHGVTGALLRLLQDGADAQRLDDRRDLLGLMANHGDNRARFQRLARAHHVFDQRTAAGAMQHFGQRRLQASALACG